MRAKEFITENWAPKTHGETNASVTDTLPGVFVHRQLRNTDAYMQYRYGVAVAAARAVEQGLVDFEQESPFAENLVQVLYVPEDEETVKLASKLMGVTPTKIADTKSIEQKGVNKTSPVKK